ncbi:MAG: hypothetical protein JO022_12835 [Acidobacteriaceae bacterium]|nr:hypothetical protein [Acidobacteriaceae bacterium]
MASNGKQLRFLSWAEFDALKSILIGKLDALAVQPDVIVAIARGGLVLSAALAHHFHCRTFGLLTIRRTPSDQPLSLPRHGIHFDLQALPDDGDHLRTIFLVDDIIGHGLTLCLATRVLEEHYPGKRLVVVTLVDDRNLEKDSEVAAIHPITAYEMSDADWVVFPWESPPGR